MIALWENPTIWLSQERQENLCIFVCGVQVSYETTCVCVRVWSVPSVACVSEYVWYVVHI